MHGEVTGGMYFWKSALADMRIKKGVRGPPSRNVGDILRKSHLSKPATQLPRFQEVSQGPWFLA